MWFTAYAVKVFLDSGSSAVVRAEREKGKELHGNGNAVSCLDAIIALWMDTVYCMPFSLMINV